MTKIYPKLNQKSKNHSYEVCVNEFGHSFDKKIALHIYFAHVNLHLIYMNPFWSAANESSLEALVVAQRKCLRFINNLYSYSPSRDLFPQQILELKQMNKYNLLMLIFKISYNLLQNNVDLRLNSGIHNCNTRQSDQFYVANYRTRFGYDNVFTRGLIEYNNINTYLRYLSM